MAPQDSISRFDFLKAPGTFLKITHMRYCFAFGYTFDGLNGTTIEIYNFYNIFTFKWAPNWLDE